MDAINLLGLYPDAINDFSDECEELLEEARKIVNEIGSEEEKSALNIDLEGEVIEYLRYNGIDVDNMTNSILQGYSYTTTNAINSCKIFSDLGITVEGYINCHDSSITVNHDNVYGGKLFDETQYALIEKITKKVNDYLSDMNIDGSEFEDELKDELESFELYELYECVNSNNLSDTVQELVNDIYEIEEKKPDKNKPVERN